MTLTASVSIVTLSTVTSGGCPGWLTSCPVLTDFTVMVVCKYQSKVKIESIKYNLLKINLRFSSCVRKRYALLKYTQFNKML